jgi:hypothetical protein
VVHVNVDEESRLRKGEARARVLQVPPPESPAEFAPHATSCSSASTFGSKPLLMSAPF